MHGSHYLTAGDLDTLIISQTEVAGSDIISGSNSCLHLIIQQICTKPFHVIYFLLDAPHTPVTKFNFHSPPPINWTLNNQI